MDDGRAVQKAAKAAYPDAMPTPHVHDLRFNATEFHRISRAAGFIDSHIELRDGEIVKMSPAHAPHAFVFGELYFALRLTIEQALSPLDILAEVSLDLSDYFQPMPDIVIWEPSRPGELPDGPIPGDAVRLVIEVADSSLSDDLGDKLIGYARAGIPEYWVADVAKSRILLHAQPDGDTYVRREPVSFGTQIDLLTLPLSIDASALARLGRAKRTN